MLSPYMFIKNLADRKCRLCEIEESKPWIVLSIHQKLRHKNCSVKAARKYSKEYIQSVAFKRRQPKPPLFRLTDKVS